MKPDPAPLLAPAHDLAPRNGASVLIDTLLALGVDTVFGYPGGAVLPLYDALHAQPRLRHVLVRHEQAAVHAAEGYLATGRRRGQHVFYGGGGLINSGPEACAAFQQLVKLAAAPCTLTLLGLGAFPASHPAFLGMLGMHGTLEANLAMHHADVSVCVGARFDERVTGRLDAFCPGAKIIHIDIDRASIGKVVRADVALRGDCAPVLAALLAQRARARRGHHEVTLRKGVVYTE